MTVLVILSLLLTLAGTVLLWLRCGRLEREVASLESENANLRVALELAQRGEK